MRILLDENLDWRLSRGLLGPEVESVARLGWAEIQNGISLKKAKETGFEVLITMDSNMTFQISPRTQVSR
jgi:predicted nuclease of predicted toxin-antitoxin system